MTTFTTFHMPASPSPELRKTARALLAKSVTVTRSQKKKSTVMRFTAHLMAHVTAAKLVSASGCLQNTMICGKGSFASS